MFESMKCKLIWIKLFQELQSLLQLWHIPHKLPPKIETEVCHCHREINVYPLIRKFLIFNVQIIKPFLHIELPGDEFAIQLASRSVAIKYVLEQWSSCTSLEVFHKGLKSFLSDNSNNSNVQQCFDRSKSFRITVESYNKHFLQKEKIDRIESIDYIPVEGDVSLKNADIEWYYIEFYGMDPTNVPEQPDHIIFGKWVNQFCIIIITIVNNKFFR